MMQHIANIWKHISNMKYEPALFEGTNETSGPHDRFSGLFTVDGFRIKPTDNKIAAMCSGNKIIQKQHMEHVPPLI